MEPYQPGEEITCLRYIYDITIKIYDINMIHEQVSYYLFHFHLVEIHVHTVTNYNSLLFLFQLPTLEKMLAYLTNLHISSSKQINPSQVPTKVNGLFPLLLPVLSEIYNFSTTMIRTFIGPQQGKCSFLFKINMQR